MPAHLYKTAGILLALLAMSLFESGAGIAKVGTGSVATPHLLQCLGICLWSAKGSALDARFLCRMSRPAAYAAALRLVGVAVVQPLYGFGFIVLMSVSRLMLHEKMHPMARLAIGLLILMPILIAFGDVSGVQYDITQHSTQVSVGIFMLAVLLTGGLLIFFSKDHPVCWAMVSGVLFGAGAVFAQIAITYLTLDELRNTDSFHALIRNEDLLFSIGAVLIAVPLNVFADYCMQVGLQQKTASRFMPIAQTVNNAVAVAGGIVIFGQRAVHWHIYLAGIALGLAGLFLLARLKHPSESPVKSGK